MAEKASVIKDLVAQGELSKEEASMLFQQLHQGERAEMVAYNPKGARFNAFFEKARYVFNHELAYEHYQDRKDLEEGIKHTIGLVAFGATGIIDGSLEGIVYMATEIAETGSFALARTANRIKSGWERGLR